MFISVLGNLRFVGLMIGGCIRRMFVICISGLQNLGNAVELSVSLGVNSYVTVNDDRVKRGQFSKAVCCWHFWFGELAWPGLAVRRFRLDAQGELLGHTFRDGGVNSMSIV